MGHGCVFGHASLSTLGSEAVVTHSNAPSSFVLLAVLETVQAKLAALHTISDTWENEK